MKTGRPPCEIDANDLKLLLLGSSVRAVAAKLGVHRNTIYNHLKKPRRFQRKVKSKVEAPAFNEYVAARKVVMFVVNELRNEKYEGKLNVASDEMIARIVHRSCAYFQ